jgi:hypothetical protein
MADLVHVSARASAADDLRNMERVRRLMTYETARRINIYPPPEFLSKPKRLKTPEHQDDAVQVPDSPSQIPDSQPTSEVEPIPKDFDLDIIPSTLPNADYCLPPFTHITPPRGTPSVYQPDKTPPQTVSLEPLNLSPRQSPQCSPNSPPEIPILTSTPKSKPLQHLLPESVHPPFLSH